MLGKILKVLSLYLAINCEFILDKIPFAPPHLVLEESVVKLIVVADTLLSIVKSKA